MTESYESTGATTADNDTARRFAEKKLGANYADALVVAGYLRAGEKVPALADNFASLGGYKQVREAVESNVTAKQLREAETTARSIVAEWTTATAEGNGQPDLSSALSSGEGLSGLVSLLGSSAQGSDSAGASSISDLFTSLSKLSEEKDKAPNDAARERIESEMQSKFDATNKELMGRLAERAADHDALNLAAVIVALGRDAANGALPGLYDAVVPAAS